LTNGQQRRNADPARGRLVVMAAAVVGAGGLLGYGFARVEARKNAEALVAHEGAEAPSKPAEASSPFSAASAVLIRAQGARRSLDTTALQQIQGELEAAVGQLPDARGEQVAVLAALAVETSVRGAFTGDAQATQQAATLAAQARALVDEHAAALDPGLVLAARARVALASGQDPLALHPAVLLPGFPDHELRHLLVAEPLWRSGSEPLPDPVRADLVRRLEQHAEPTALERLLLALAMPGSEGAQSLVSEVRLAAPSQPLARAVEEHLRRTATVAVADPLPMEPGPTEPEPEPSQPEVTRPEVTRPEVAKPEVAKPEVTKPGPSQSGGTDAKKGAGKPKVPKAPAADLATEGCKLVQSGKAEQGFAMLQKAFDLDPRDTKVILCMAEGHMKLGRLPSARAMVERVLRSSGKNKKALSLAAKIEDKLGNERSAADYYRKLLEIDPDDGTARAYVDKHGG
jgi:tetratricopeptide (TPR) repeat protein